MDELEKIVAKDLKGEPLNEAEKQRLEGNPTRWRDILVASLQDVDTQLARRRADWMADRTQEKKIAYENWKRGAVGYKLAVLGRLREVKAIKRAKEEPDRESTLVMILEELKSIRKFIEIYIQRQK